MGEMRTEYRGDFDKMAGEAAIAEEREMLCAAAREAALRAYAPYSGFRVGAAVLGARGVHRGANVENASYGLSLCAEQVALAGAVAKGDRPLVALAVACIDADRDCDLSLRMPCGACRQWLAELAPTARIYIDGCDRPFRLEELLPSAFRLGRSPEDDTAP